MPFATVSGEDEFDVLFVDKGTLAVPNSDAEDEGTWTGMGVTSISRAPFFFKISISSSCFKF